MEPVPEGDPTVDGEGTGLDEFSFLRLFGGLFVVVLAVSGNLSLVSLNYQGAPAPSRLHFFFLIQLGTVALFSAGFFGLMQVGSEKRRYILATVCTVVFSVLILVVDFFVVAKLQ